MLKNAKNARILLYCFARAFGQYWKMHTLWSTFFAWASERHCATFRNARVDLRCTVPVSDRSCFRSPIGNPVIGAVRCSDRRSDLNRSIWPHPHRWPDDPDRSDTGVKLSRCPDPVLYTSTAYLIQSRAHTVRVWTDAGHATAVHSCFAAAIAGTNCLYLIALTHIYKSLIKELALFMAWSADGKLGQP